MFTSAALCEATDDLLINMTAKGRNVTQEVWVLSRRIQEGSSSQPKVLCSPDILNCTCAANPERYIFLAGEKIQMHLSSSFHKYIAHVYLCFKPHPA